MNLYEYQAKELLKKYGIKTPAGIVVNTYDDALKAADKLGFPLVIKAQVHAGGRGKAGAICVVKTAEEFKKEFNRIMGMEVKGLKVKKILLEQALKIEKQIYLGIALDRSTQKNIIIASLEGGIDIEEAARNAPEKIMRVHLDTLGGLDKTDTSALAPFDKAAPGFFQTIKALCSVYKDIDAQLVEINPLVVTTDGSVIACDAKIIIDDNALFRHPDLSSIKEDAEDNELEIESHKRGLAYVKLNGNIGIIGNGAGLVMTTMDEVQRAGGSPANFLDIGGGAKSGVMRNALEILFMDKDVRGIFINIFGGITRCDEVAKGIVQALEAAPRKIPIVLRLTGTCAKDGKEILQKSALISADTMEEGAQKVVSAISI